jgi:hypothetical protein
VSAHRLSKISERRRRAAELLDKAPAITLRELAASLGVSIATAWGDLAALGLRTANEGGRPRGGGVISDEEIRACHAVGNCDAAIAREYHVSRQDISRRRADLGLAPNHDPTWPTSRGPIPFVRPPPGSGSRP